MGSYIHTVFVYHNSNIITKPILQLFYPSAEAAGSDADTAEATQPTAGKAQTQAKATSDLWAFRAEQTDPDPEAGGCWERRQDQQAAEKTAAFRQGVSVLFQSYPR